LIGLLAGLGTAIGVLVAVVGLPYGRLNYTAFAGLYHNGGTPALGSHLAFDCAPGGSVQDACTIFNNAGTTVVDVVFQNNVVGYDVAAFQFTAREPTAHLFPPPVADPLGFNGNPDFNEAGPGSSGTWNCSLVPHTNDDASEAAPVENSKLACFVQAGLGPSVAAGVQFLLADVTYNVLGTNGVSTITAKDVVVGDNGGVELLSCNPVIAEPGSGCFPTTITITDPPADTPTNTATSTNTPLPTNTPTATPEGPVVVKIPESCIAPSNPNNCDPDIPAANLWLCVTGPCSGAGEGNLYVYEYASSVSTQDQDGDTDQDGLGAYEFDVEYDNFVIQSLNPEDIVFRTPPGSVAPYPNGTDGVADGEGAARGPANCSFSLVFENVIHFGCVTTGPTPDGPLGAFDLARLNLIPHPDLTNDLFPGNDNGVLTVIKDNGCELVDVFGHPVLGSVGGGLTVVCGDLAVTVRILEGDLNLDCEVDVADQQLIAYRYGSFFGSLLYSQWYDLEPNLHDLDIDIKDLQKVFGRDGSTCQNPIPAQTPAPPPAPFGN
jgi:hypothetical protein